MVPLSCGTNAQVHNTFYRLNRIRCDFFFSAVVLLHCKYLLELLTVYFWARKAKHTEPMRLHRESNLWFSGSIERAVLTIRPSNTALNVLALTSFLNLLIFIGRFNYVIIICFKYIMPRCIWVYFHFYKSVLTKKCDNV